MTPVPPGNGTVRELLADGQHVDVVYERLREAILRGTLEPEEEISQVQLAKDLGVSRTPLREAIRMLEREGLVDTAPNRRPRIAGFSLPDLEQLYTIRLPLEAMAIRLSIPRLTPEEVAGLEGTMARMGHFAAAEDYERWEVPHRDFHQALVQHAGARTTTLLRQLSDHAERYRRLYTLQAPRAWSVGVAEHRAIMDAVKGKDADEGARRLCAHLARTARSVFTMVDGDYAPRRLEEVLANLLGSGDLDGAAA
jgi:DNA-binding GntR family transcriptional regulator